MKLFIRFGILLGLQLGVLVASIIPHTAQAARPIDEYWNESNIDATDLFHPNLIDQKNCFSALSQFKGCFDAISSLVGGNGELFAVSKIEYDRNPSRFKVEKSDIDGIVIASIDPNYKDGAAGKSMTPKEAMAKRKDLLALEAESIQELFERFKKLEPKNRFDSFKRVIEFAKQKNGEFSKAAIANAINIFLSRTYDPHSKILPTKYMMDKQKSADDSFIGIGIELDASKGTAAVGKVMPNGAAAIAGMKRGDVILKVDSVELGPLSTEEKVKTIRGPIDSKTILTVKRGEKTLQVPIVRKQVVLKNVEFTGVGVDGVRMGHIKLRQFAGMKDCYDLRANLKFAEVNDAKAIILDLRNDPGGATDVAMCVIASFLDNAEEILSSGKSFSYSVDLQSEKRTEFADVALLESINKWIEKEANSERLQTLASTNLPMTILVNAGSASASEIVAGTLQHYRRAWIVGETTFGKGTAQSGNLGEGWHGKQGIVFMQTKDRYYLPSGRSPQWVGVNPDFEVFEKPGMKSEDVIHLREVDRFPNSLIADKTQPSSVVRTAEIAKIKSDCLDSRPTASAFEKIERANEEPADFELLYAQDLMWCELQNTGAAR